MEKAQGALEYLLLIGGGVLVAVIVVTLLMGLSDTSKENVEATVTSGFGRIAEVRNDLVGGEETIKLQIHPENGNPAYVSTTILSTWSSATMENPSVTSSDEQFIEGDRSLKLVALDSGQYWENYVYIQVWTGDYIIKAGDHLRYSTYIPSTTQDKQAMVEARISGIPGVDYLRWDYTPSNVDNHPADTWKNWDFDLTPLAGGTIFALGVVKDTGGLDTNPPEESTSQGMGLHEAYYDNIRIVTTS